MEANGILAARAQDSALTALLLRAPLFGRVHGRQLQPLIQAGRRLVLESGQRLCGPGERVRGFFVLLEGSLECGGAPLTAPNAVGEVSLLTGTPVRAGIVSVGRSVLWEVPRRAFALALVRDPAFCQRLCRNLIGQLAARLQEANQQVGELERRRSEAADAVRDAEIELNDLRLLSTYR